MLNPEAPQLALDFAAPTDSSAPELIKSIGHCRTDIVLSAINSGKSAGSVHAFSMELPEGEYDLWRPEIGLAEQAENAGQIGLAALQLGLAGAGAGGRCRVET